jgi:hypothetical protein
MPAKSNPTTTTGVTPTPEQIAERARSIWIAHGSPGGRDLEHWLDAERQLRQEFASRPMRRPPSAAGKDLDEAERRLDGLIEEKPSPARRTPDGEQL